ncbi:MAG: hydroxymethylglutaryl-CoA lyase [Actinomycetota bacterium]|nr:hydroxymethylglutaryl-CoA lyase [Actinomycetota bacterium]
MPAAEVTICEVGPRDGLQNETEVLAPDVRAELVNHLSAAGVSRIEAASFVSPERVPAMAAAEEVVRGIVRRRGVRFAGLVLNEQGYDRLATTTLDEVHFTLAATESFNRRNAGRSVADSLAAWEVIACRAHEDGRRATATISVAFGCPFEGGVAPERVLELAERTAATGADEVVLADTIGVAVPRQVRNLLFEGARVGKPLGIHLHNTRSTAPANAYAALEAGATVFDASVGGLGGCPFAPRASGNIATEDLVYLLHGEGIETGIDLQALIGVSAWLEQVLGRELPGQVYRAGTFAPVAG